MLNKDIFDLFSCCVKNPNTSKKNKDRFHDNKSLEEIIEGIHIPNYIYYIYKYETNNYYYVISNSCYGEMEIGKYMKKIMVEYVPEECIDETNVCAICLEETKKNESIVKMSVCNHYYHEKCALATLNTKEECPLCRKNIEKDIEIIENFKHKQNSYSSSEYSSD